MAYANLRAEMARKDISVKKIAEAMNKSVAKISKNLNGYSGDFTISEAFKIRELFFPDLEIDYLFCRSDK
jgi:transcriptional regulator with XRE-family HTH domain